LAQQTEKIAAFLANGKEVEALIYAQTLITDEELLPVYS